MPICGLKLTYAGLILSVWGIVQLALTGLSFEFRSVALIEDINLKESYQEEAALAHDIELGYSQSALNCWIASLLYLLTFCMSAQQYWLHQRVEAVQSEQFY